MKDNVIKIDNIGRIVIPKAIREILHLESEISFSINADKGTLTLYNRKYYGIKESIETRLKNKSIGGSERNFLEKLLKNYNE